MLHLTTPFGYKRVYDFTYLVELLFWKPFDYFKQNPHVRSVWIELNDPFLRRVLVKNQRQVIEQTEFALIAHRADITFEFCQVIRLQQSNFFRAHNLEFPSRFEFTAALPEPTPRLNS